MALANILLLTGMVVLVHAGYSACEHRAYLKVVDEPFQWLPWDITIETLAGLVACFVGVVLLKANFDNIHWPVILRDKSYEAAAGTPSFHTFNHRGRSLFTQPE
jgi:hypothetical protein